MNDIKNFEENSQEHTDDIIRSLMTSLVHNTKLLNSLSGTNENKYYSVNFSCLNK